MIKVLHLFSTLDNGGVESFLYNYYSHMNQEKIKFDIIVPNEKIGFLEKKFKKLNSDIFHVHEFKKNPIKQIKEVEEIIKKGNYDIVHCHGYKSVLGILLAKKHNVKVRIIHSHMAYVKENIFQKAIRKIITFLANRFSTDRFACGIDAAIWLYGEKLYNNGKIKIINNAVDLNKFKYNEISRKKIREELGIKKEFVIGNVARLTEQKNQIFLLQLLKELIKKDKNIKLILVGNGEDEKMLKDKCREFNLQNNVLFLGLRTDIPEILSALDMFILPSLYEGLPVVLAEVQASGVNCIVSNSVTKEIAVTNNIKYVALNDNINKWINLIFEFKKNKQSRSKNYEEMKNGKYDIEFQADKLFDYYSKKIQKGENLR